MKKMILSLGFAALMFAGVASANGNGNHSQSGAFGNLGGSYQVNTYNSTGNGSSDSDIAGGSMAQTAVHGTGGTAQYTTNGGVTSAYSNLALGNSGVATQTGGSSTSYGASVGTTFGQADGQTNGAVGGDFGATAHADYTATSHGADIHAAGYVNVGTYGNFPLYVLGGYAGY